MFLFHSKQRIKDLQDRLSKVESLLYPTSQDKQSQVLVSTSLPSQSLPSAPTAPSQVVTLLGHKQDASAVTSNFSVFEALLGGNASMPSNIFETVGHYWHQVAERLRTYTLGVPVSLQESETVLLILSIEDVCAELPLFYIPSFLERLRRQHTAERYDHPSWWACINALIALAIWRRMANRSFCKMSVIVWAFFKNAYASFPNVVQHAKDLLAVQALLVMAMFMTTSADIRTTSLLLSTACRAIQTIGLHIMSHQNNLSFLEKDTRNRVFWVAFILETETSISYGTPSMLTEDDLDIDLPAERSPDGCGLITLKGEQRHINIFRLRAELALIQSRVQKKLYSAKSLKQSGSQLLQMIRELQCELENWRSRVPLEVRPEFDRTLESSMRDTPVVNLHFMYFHCISMIHWTALRRSSWNAAMKTTHSVSQYGAAAKATISLLNCLPNPQILGLW